jgi:phosphate transport system protein
MFRQLFKAFKAASPLDDAYKRSFEMLDLTYEMFIKARKSLRESEDADPSINVNEMDIKVNKYERKVRRTVFRHLAISGAEDLYSGLVLTSIIIDLERIGDYTKNIVELAANFPMKLHAPKHEEDLRKVEAAVEDIFKRARRCFETGDAVDGEKLIRDYIWINPLCDEIVLKYVKTPNEKISTSEAVTLALYFRYLKRINSHLQNIVTSIVNPFDRIGFLPKDMKVEAKSKTA